VIVWWEITVSELNSLEKVIMEIPGFALSEKRTNKPGNQSILTVWLKFKRDKHNRAIMGCICVMAGFVKTVLRD